MKIGYARVSTIDQNLEAQIDALNAFGCEIIHQEKISAATKERPALEELLKVARKGDTVVVYKLDRLGRSLKDLTKLITGFSDGGIGFVSLTENIDTATTSGKLLFHIMASLAEFERELIVERTHAGLKSARARGRVGGRPKGLSQAYKEKAASILALYESEKVSNDQIRKDYNIGSKETLYRILSYAKDNRKIQAQFKNVVPSFGQNIIQKIIDRYLPTRLRLFDDIYKTKGIEEVTNLKELEIFLRNFGTLDDEGIAVILNTVNNS